MSTIDERNIKYWLAGTGSWIQTNEPLSLQEINIGLDANDAKPSPATDLPPGQSSRSFDNRFEGGERHREHGHWSTNEAEGRTGAARTLEGVPKLKSTGLDRTLVVRFAVNERSVSGGRKGDGEMLHRWSMQTSEDPWNLERSEGILQ